MKHLNFLEHSCCGCRKILDGDALALCPDCLKQWQMEYQSAAHYTLLHYDEGRRNLPVLALGSYDSQVDSLTKKIVLAKKTRRVRDVDLFLGESMAREVERYFHFREDEAVVIGVPRSRKNILREGFDHVTGPARAMAETLRIPFSSALCRSGFTARADQKELTFWGRILNAKESYAVELDKIEEISGRVCLLVDDVCTTGASMCACADLLMAFGAADLLGVCFCLVQNHNYRKGRTSFA